MCCTAFGTGVHSVMNNVANFVRTLPCHRHVVVVTFVLRRHQTNIHIEIQELEGGVRATSLLCLLGFSVGIGSFFIYRLYTRLFSVSPVAGFRRERHVSDLCSAKSCESEKSNVVTPDSGIVADSSLPLNLNDCDTCTTVKQHTTPSLRQRHRHFSELADFNLRRSRAGSLEDVLCPDHKTDVESHLRRSWAVADWLAKTDLTHDDTSSCTSEIFIDRKNLFDSLASRSSSADHGFASGWMTESAEFNSLDIPRHKTAAISGYADDVGGSSTSFLTTADAQSVERLKLDFFTTSQQLFDVGLRLTASSLRKRGISESGIDDNGPWGRRRRRFSLASGGSISDCDYRESLVSKGFSVDLGEDLEGMMTPPMGESTVNPNTVAGMESLQNALRQIQMDIADMNEKFDGLRMVVVPNTVNLQLNPGVSADWSTDDDRCSCSESHSGFRSSSEREVDGESCCEQPDVCATATDLVWDYRSDLLPTDNTLNHGFVAQRPIIGQSCDDNRNYRVNSASSLPRTGSDVSSLMGHDGVHDMYIDDDFAVGTLPNDSLTFDGHRQRPQWTIDEMDSDSCSLWSTAKSSPTDGHGTLCFVCSNRTVKNATFDCCCHGGRQYPHSHSSCQSSRRSSASSSRSHRRYRRSSIGRTEQDQIPNGTCVGNHVRCRQCFATCERSPGSPVEATGHFLHGLPTSTSTHSFQCDQCNNFPVGRKPSCYGRVVGEPRDICKILDADLHMSQRSLAAKKNCQEIIRMWAVSTVRSVGEDSYCAIRAVLYATLLDNHPILSRFGNLNDCCQRFVSYAEAHHKYLRSWNFAATESLCLENAVIDKLLECLRSLFEQVDIVGKLSSRQQRDQYLSAMLNGNPDIDLRMIEAAKVLMMLGAISACEDSAAGTEMRTPLFVTQLFGRSSSVTAETFFHNHVNCIEDAPVLCMQPLELSFLSYTLGVRLQVFHSSRSGKCDFLRHYPDEGADHLPLVRLLECNSHGLYYVLV